MRFQLDTRNLTNLIKAGVTSVIALAIFTACSDTISAPADSVRPPAAGVYVVETQVPESEKNPSGSLSGSQLVAAGSAAMLVAPSGLSSSLAVAAPYAVSAVPFAPEAAPTLNNGPICDDCVMFNVPLGFEFSFYGVAYSTLNISSNGFVGFSSPLSNGCCKGGLIPSDDATDNIIALGWSDWSPQLVSGGVKWETRGNAPNRRFVLQFNNVPEFRSVGRLTVQLVLEEETNDITIHTTKLATYRSDHIVTQGIENGSGLLSASLPGRVRTFLKIYDDAVKFSPAPNLRPVLSIPADISLDLEIGSCSRSVDVGSASATDDTEGFSISAARSDLLQLNEPYPAGATIVKWTVTDAGGLKASADQTVTLKENVNPSISAPANVSANNDPGLGSAVVDAGTAVAEDNCPGYVSVKGVRSDAAALSAPFPVGVTTISWQALDVSGNSAVASQTVTVVDVEAPVFNSIANVSVDATSRDGAAVSFAASASDNVAVTSISCSHASGSFFPVGSTSVTCTASDAADNRASASFVVTVVGPADHLNALIALVEAAELREGVANPLLNQLRASIDGLDAPHHVSCNKLGDFIRMLTSSKTRAELSAQEYNDLLAYAHRIQSMLGC
ncbi:MAG TPA: HYR domain-containing protein [Gemmatimonadaceae bacterium]|nr:HYR domain-containing protein [Gemmatimonadaceae bacterium]